MIISDIFSIYWNLLINLPADYFKSIARCYHSQGLFWAIVAALLPIILINAIIQFCRHPEKYGCRSNKFW